MPWAKSEEIEKYILIIVTWIVLIRNSSDVHFEPEEERKEMKGETVGSVDNTYNIHTSASLLLSAMSP